jgi:hypothetical protein
MMSCTTSVAWSRSVSLPCYTEHGQRYGAILSGRITTVAMSKSDQLACVALLNRTIAACPHALQAPR